MKKIQKLNKKSLSVIIFLILLIPLFYSIKKVLAGYWPIPSEESWSEYICEATTCGTSNGERSQEIYCQVESNGDEWCEPVESSKILTISCTDAIITPCPTGTPTPTPTPTVTPTPKPSNPSSPSNPSTPTCDNTPPTKTGANFHVYRKGGDAIAKWTPTEGNKVNIYYKKIKSNTWEYSVRDIQNNGYYLIQKLGNLDVTFALQQSNDCAGGPLSNEIVDGATDGWVLFR